MIALSDSNRGNAWKIKFFSLLTDKKNVKEACLFVLAVAILAGVSLTRAHFLIFRGRAPANETTIDDCNFDPSGKLDFATLKRVITTDSCQVKSIEQFLAKLPESVRSNPALFYQSHSLQGPHLPDYLNPRAILMSQADGKQMMMTFNGKSSDPGYQNLEVVEIDKTVPRPSTEVFTYYDIHFGQNSGQISDPNPKQCTACHGQPARPIYEGYPKWEGSYGSYDTVVNADESTQFQKFLAASPNHTRYQYLKFPTSNGDPINNPNLLDGGVNVRMNGTLQQGNALLVARIAQATPDYNLFKFAIAGAMTGCDVPSFFPNEVRLALEKSLSQRLDLGRSITKAKINSVLNSFRKDGTGQFGEIMEMGPDGLSNGGQSSIPDLATFVKQQFSYWKNSKVLFQLWIDTLDKQGLQRSTTVPTRLRYVLESRGIDLSAWFLDLQQPTYRDMSGGGHETSMNGFLKDDPTLPGSNIQYPQYQDANLCQQLKDQSLKAFSQTIYSVPKQASSHLAYQASLIKGAYPATFANTCAQCHAHEQIGPAIPFDDADKFDVWIQDPKHQEQIKYRLSAPEGEKMPPTRNLSGLELQEIQTYLNLLK